MNDKSLISFQEFSLKFPDLAIKIEEYVSIVKSKLTKAGFHQKHTLVDKKKKIYSASKLRNLHGAYWIGNFKSTNDRDQAMQVLTKSGFICTAEPKARTGYENGVSIEWPESVKKELNKLKVNGEIRSGSKNKNIAILAELLNSMPKKHQKTFMAIATLLQDHKKPTVKNQGGELFDQLTKYAGLIDLKKKEVSIQLGATKVKISPKEIGLLTRAQFIRVFNKQQSQS